MKNIILLVVMFMFLSEACQSQPVYGVKSVNGVLANSLGEIVIPVGAGGAYTASSGVVLQGSNFKIQDTLEGAGSKLIWMPARYSFRAGQSTGTQTNVANIGLHSFGSGYNSLASGQYSFAHGREAQATGVYSMAMGSSATSTGTASFAAGTVVNATNYGAIALGANAYAWGNSSIVAGGFGNWARGDNASAAGYYSYSNNYAGAVVGSFNDTAFVNPTVWNSLNKAFQVGIGTANTARANAFEVYFNGRTRLNKYGVNTFAGTPTYGLGVDANGYVVEYTAGSGGATYTASSGVVLQGNNFKIQDTLDGAGTKFIWMPAKNAFRAGAVSGTQWDEVNIGNWSIAMGRNGLASSNDAIALGTGSIATGNQAVAIQGGSATGGGSFAYGGSSKAEGTFSQAIGVFSESRYQNSTTLGFQLKNKLINSTVIGKFNDTTLDVSTQPSTDTNHIAFVVGIGMGGTGVSYIPGGRANGLEIQYTGKTRLNWYGQNRFTGTPTYALAVDANGYLVETALGGGGGGVTTMAAIGSTPNANGASISGSTQTLQPADGTYGGVLTAIAQTIAGRKTYNDYITTAQIAGSASSGGNLLLQSTTNATKGKITIGNNVIDEVLGNVVIGAATNTFTAGSTGSTGGALTISKPSGNNGLTIANGTGDASGYIFSINTTTSDNQGVKFNWWDGVTNTFFQYAGNIGAVFGTSSHQQIKMPSTGEIQYTWGGTQTAMMDATNGKLTTTQYKLSALNTAPASATATGILGEIRVVADYIYVCIATNTWVRTALTTW